jgi:hypothetical protein
MGRLVVNNAMTVNGAFEAPSPEPDGWLVLDADSNQVSLEQFLVADAMVLGRKTYEGLAAVWPQLADNPTLGLFADRMEESSNPVDGGCSPDHAAPSGLAVRLDHLLVGLCAGWDGAGAYHSGCCLIQVATAARSIGPLVSTSSTGPSRPSGPTRPSSAALSCASST